MSRSSVPGSYRASGRGGRSSSPDPLSVTLEGGSRLTLASSISAWSEVAYASKETFAQEQHSGDSTSNNNNNNFRFPPSDSSNKKIALWFGKLTSIEKIDALVCPTNEAMNDRSGIGRSIHKAAGPKLAFECSRLGEGCHTGEAVSTGPGLLANQGIKRIIHTVGPKYNVKYDTAAENALHGCYRSCLRVLKEQKLRTIAFPCVYEERKGYPRDKAAHIAVRTIRRFLERYGDGVDKVVLCIPADADKDIKLYQTVMPLYFPRDAMEAKASEDTLPEDTGNEIGEKIIDERKIKIMDFNASVFAEQAASEDTSRAKGKRLHLPEGDALANALASTGMSESAGDFGTMDDDFDRSRLERIRHRGSSSGKMPASPNSGTSDPETKRSQTYDKYRRKAFNEDFSDFDARNVMYESGVDAQGRVVMVFVAGNLPNMRLDDERVLLYVIRKCDRVAEKPFIVVYVHTKMGYGNRPDRKSLRKAAHEVLHKKYSKNLKRLYVLHPSFWVKSVFWFMTPFLSKKFWSKMIYIDRVGELYNHFDHQLLKLPESTYLVDLKKGARSRKSGGGTSTPPPKKL